jgi:hypothetical protein
MEDFIERVYGCQGNETFVLRKESMLQELHSSTGVGNSIITRRSCMRSMLKRAASGWAGKAAFCIYIASLGRDPIRCVGMSQGGGSEAANCGMTSEK